MNYVIPVLVLCIVIHTESEVGAISETGDSTLLPKINVGGIIYSVSNIKLTQRQAAVKCLQYGMELINIPNKRTDDMIKSLIQQWKFDGYYWTSARRQPNKKWIWGDLQPITYVNWVTGKPNDMTGTEDCIYLFHSGKWNNTDCDEQNYFICELPNSEHRNYEQLYISNSNQCTC